MSGVYDRFPLQPGATAGPSNGTGVVTINGITGSIFNLTAASIGADPAGAAAAINFGNLPGKPTTLAGYGIADAQPLDADLSAIAALTTTSFGRSVLTQADGASVRTLIGAGTSSFSGSFSALSGLPTTLGGYGITDGQTSAQVQTAISAAIGALTAGSPAQLDTFIEVYNRFLSDEGTLMSLTTAVAGKEPAITAGTAGQYWRGDKTFAPLNSTAVGLGNVPNVDATNAGNIATGTLATERLPPTVVRDYAAEASTAIDPLITGKTPSATTQARFSAASFAGHAYTLNPAAWFAPYAADLTCVSAGSSVGWRATLVTSKHAVTAHHINMAVGTTLDYVDGAGTVYTRTVTAVTNVLQDLDLVTLNADLPAGVRPALVMPPVLPGGCDFGGSPVLYFDKDLLGHVAEVDAMFGPYFSSPGGADVASDSIVQPASPLRAPWCQNPGPAVSGDSSSPIFLILGGRPVFLGSFYNAFGQAPDPGANAAVVNAALPSGYRLMAANLPSQAEPTTFVGDRIFRGGAVEFDGDVNFAGSTVDASATALKLAGSADGMVILGDDGSAFAVGVGAGQSVRFNAAGTGFEPYTPLALGTTGTAAAAGNHTHTPASLGAEATANKGAANGYAPLGADTKVPAAFLPSYVDDVLEFSTLSGLPATGETGKIYVTTDTNYEYRWSGSTYVRLVASPGSTDAVPEGATNKYYTDSRAQAAAPPETAATIGTLTHAATAKATPVDADEVGLVDSAATFGLKRLTWANLKATIKTYFDAIYAAVAHAHSGADITSGTVAIARGGTGASTAAAAAAALVDGNAINPAAIGAVTPGAGVFTNLTATGAFTASTAAAGATNLALFASTSSGGRAIIQVAAGGGSGGIFDMRAYGPGFTESFAGTSVASGASLSANTNQTPGPFVFQNYANGPIVFGTNNIFRGQIYAGGGWYFGPQAGATDPGTGNALFGGTVTGTGTTTLALTQATRFQLLPAGYTTTPAGTTGNRTINTPAGTVRVAGGASAVVVTNSLVTAGSYVTAIVRSNDATAYVKNVVPAAGSFTINLGASATAETEIQFELRT